MTTLIEINKLEGLLKDLIKRLKNSGVTELSFEEDYYWFVPLDKLNSFPDAPELTIGSLKDDIAFLDSLINEEYVTDFLELERLSSLFRFISKKNV